MIRLLFLCRFFNFIFIGQASNLFQMFDANLDVFYWLEWGICLVINGLAFTIFAQLSGLDEI